MNDRPIIFSAPMIRALLGGRKTQTRRVLKPQPAVFTPTVIDIGLPDYDTDHDEWGQWQTIWSSPSMDCPMGEPSHEIWRPLRGLRWAVGDRLWVRESFVRYHEMDDDQTPCSELMTCYRADGWPCDGWYDPDREETRDSPPWKPSIHMPRSLSRLTLTVTEVRVERLQDISEADAEAEGVERIDDPRGVCWRSYETLPDGTPHPHAAAPNSSPVTSFREIWTGIHGREAWDANPWVAAISFTVQHQNIDALSEVAA
jgi:hypothetical protein